MKRNLNNPLKLGAYLWVAVLALITLNGSLQAQKKPKLAGGPMFGHVGQTSAGVWLMLRETETIQFTLDSKDGHKVEQILHLSEENYYGKFVPLLLQFEDLHPGQEYALSLKLDEVAVDQTWSFFTLDNSKEGDVTFLFGSCAYIGKGMGKIVEPPGKNYEVYLSMLQQEADFMLWLGDNVYFLNGEYNSHKRMMKKMIKVRQNEEMNSFLSSMPQYAIWDDHDFGPNDGDRRWKNKDESLEVFQRFWPNPAFGTPEVKGNFCHFDYKDCSFFLMDDRYYRDSKDFTDFLGPGQLEWLKKGLKESDATFKFIAIGSQVLNDLSHGESYAKFYAERKNLFNFIQNEEIPGVLFLTGDRHFTEVLKLDREGTYPFYDMTLSPISMWVYPIGENHREFHNPLRVENTLHSEMNFGKIMVNGAEGDRTMSLEILSKKGDLLGKLSVHQNELGW